MWQRRIAAQLEAGAAAVTLIGNLGAGSGASLEHPHEQLFATPVVPPLLLDELLEAERHRNRYGTCVVCDELERAGDRLGARRRGRRAGCPTPAASTASCGWPRSAHEADFRAADPGAVAPALRRALTAVKASIGGAPLNFWLHTAPAELRGTFHWHLEFAPRTATLAGFELGTDIAVVTKAPEAAAAEYRAALPPA